VVSNKKWLLILEIGDEIKAPDETAADMVVRPRCGIVVDKTVEVIVTMLSDKKAESRLALNKLAP
jgi:hypothetical protein